ncbi:MAG: tetratricopeptide repeat protein [Candidatus Omnitrophica bacterium]|nr:tetratricopeptide repeat protein [Candidatus Omnitrophota bacterium]
MKSKIFGKFLLWTIAPLFFVFSHLSFSFAMNSQEDQVNSISAYAMGVIHDLKGDTDQAISAYEHSAKFEHSSAVRLRLGADYARLGKLDEAKKELDALLKDDPDNVQGRYLLALIYTIKKDYDKAAEEYEKILTSLAIADPQNVEIYGYLGQLYYSKKDYEKAIQQFEKVLAFEPTENADLVYLIGSLYLEIKNRDKALELFVRALKIEPDHDEALNSLGYLYAEDGARLDEALELVQRAVKIAPKNGAYLDSLGWVYFKKGDYTAALNYLNKASSLLQDPAIYEHLGDVYFKMGDKVIAKKFWKLSIGLNPNQDQVVKKLKALDSL